MQKHWDIFCRVVDNFGDIGICWRLAKQLQVEHGLHVCLWIDDFAAAKKIIPNLDLAKNQQICNEITLLKWDDTADFSDAAKVVIEAFSCELPPAYLAAMLQKKSQWINLEYLSAEPWVDDFHAKPSPQANGLIRHFYFPGFTAKTGGLIRESFDYAQNRRAALEENQTSTVRSEFGEGHESVLKISLFCYPNAPIHDLFTALQTQGLSPQNIPAKAGYSYVKPNNHAVHVYAPQSSVLPNIAQFFGKDNVQVGDKLTKNNLTVEILPFLSQTDYDALLRDCDLNFVRGEDSWVRAIWAGKPFIWQPYIQDDNAHMVKLNAFLEMFYANFDKKILPCEAHRCWSGGQLPEDVLDAYLDDLNAIHAYTQMQSAALANQLDLAAKLVAFCNAFYKT